MRRRLYSGSAAVARRVLPSNNCQLQLETEKKANDRARAKQEAGLRLPQICCRSLSAIRNAPQMPLTSRSCRLEHPPQRQPHIPGASRASGQRSPAAHEVNSPLPHGTPPAGLSRDRGSLPGPGDSGVGTASLGRSSPGAAVSHAPFPVPPEPPSGRGPWESLALPRAPGGPTASHAPRGQGGRGVRIGGGRGCLCVSRSPHSPLSLRLQSEAAARRVLCGAQQPRCARFGGRQHPRQGGRRRGRWTERAAQEQLR